MSPTPSPSDVRCFCASNHLLAVVERNSTGRPQLRVKSMKRGEAVVDLIALLGVVKIRCRACGRWHRITIRRDKIDVDDTSFAPVFPPDS